VAEVVELGSVPGFVVFDLPGAPISAGGTRLAADVGRAEVALLARAMTYKFAVLAANAPYTAQGATVLGQRGVVALPDFVCNAGAVIGYRSPADATPDQVLATVEATIGGIIREALSHSGGPLAGACERAGAFLRGWWGEPPAPPFAVTE
jgi:hypothetical protein